MTHPFAAVTVGRSFPALASRTLCVPHRLVTTFTARSQQSCLVSDLWPKPFSCLKRFDKLFPLLLRNLDRDIPKVTPLARRVSQSIYPSSCLPSTNSDSFFSSELSLLSRGTPNADLKKRQDIVPWNAVRLFSSSYTTPLKPLEQWSASEVQKWLRSFENGMYAKYSKRLSWKALGWLVSQKMTSCVDLRRWAMSSTTLFKI